MHTRMQRGVAITVMALALFFVGNNADAAWRDWLPWPFSPRAVPQEQTPSASAQMPPAGTMTGTAPATQPPPPTGMTGTGTTTGTPANTQPPIGGTPPVGTQPPQGQQGGPGDRIFCASLNKEVTRTECAEADRQKQGQQPGQHCEPAQVFCYQINRCVSPQECAAATPKCEPGQMPSADKPCKMDEGQQPNVQPEDRATQCKRDGGIYCPSMDDPAKFFCLFGERACPAKEKPPVPEGQKQEDEERMRKEQDERFRKESEESRRQAEEKMRWEQEQKEKMHREQEEQNQREIQPMPEEPREKPVFVDKRWVQDTLRQIKDQGKELRRLLKRAQKLAGAESLVTAMQALATKLDEHTQKIKSTQGEDLQEAVQEFHDAQYWDEINSFRTKIELPKQLKDIERELKRNEKLLNQKSFKRLAEFGLNLDKIKADFANIRATLDKVRGLIGTGDAEDIQEAMQEIWEGGHPGEIGGVLHQMREMTEGLRRIKNADIRELVLEVFQPVIEAVNDGDYREANQILGELRFEMQKIFTQLYRFRGRTLSAGLQKKLEALESRIQEKLEAGGGGETMKAMPQPPPTP